MISQFQISNNAITLFNRNIICDLDDVLGDFAPVINHHMNQASDIQLSVSDYLAYDYYERHNLSKDEFGEIIRKEEVFLKMPVKKGAVEGLQMLVDKGFTIHIVTARGGFNFSHSQTREWLEKNNVPHHHLHIVDTSITPKSEVYNSIAGGAACLIDDAPYNIIDAMDSTPSLLPIIIDQPWNRAFKGIDKWNSDYHGQRFNTVKDFADRVEYQVRAAA